MTSAQSTLKQLLAVPALMLLLTLGIAPSLAAAQNETGTDNDTISFGDAQQIAIDSLQGTGWEVVDSESDEDEYQFELRRDGFEAEVTVDAYTGEILESETESTREDDEEETTTEYIVTEDEAIDLARDALNSTGWEVEEVEREDRVYEVELRKDNVEAEVRVDGTNGEILRTEQETEEADDSDSDEADEEDQNASDVENLEEARSLIAELREEIRELREELRELREERDEDAREKRGNSANAPGQNRDAGRPDNIERPSDAGNNNETPAQAARDNIDDIPGGENSNRPGFVTRMLRAMFN